MNLQIKLKGAAADRVRRGDDWIAPRDCVVPEGVQPGDVANFVDTQGRYLAGGFVHPGSRITGRVLVRDPEVKLDAGWFQHRVERALSLRRKMIGTETDMWRAVHGEGDGLPGLVIDRYGPVWVVQIQTAGMERWKKAVQAGLAAGGGDDVRVIVERRDGTGRKQEGLETGEPLFWKGQWSGDPVTVHDRGMQFQLDPMKGQKTGAYLDQRENRYRVGDWVKALGSKRVLDLFCYHGGFGLFAKAAGAQHVTFVDSSAAAVDAARNNWTLNGMADSAASFIKKSAVHYLGERDGGGPAWDLVIADPPKLTQGSVHKTKALRFHRRILEGVLPHINDGGMLVVADCSGAIHREPFQKAVAQAARSANVELQLMETRAEACDHPAPPAFRRLSYLKVLFLLVRK